jgi:putative transposase
MPNTYTQVYLHFIFTVKGKRSLINVRHNYELQKYITGIIQNRGHKMLAINNMPDHMHILIGYGTNMSISDLMRDIKSISSKFINEKKWIHGKFEWQNGYGVFSYSKSQIDRVIKYINNQQIHHKKQSFREEYLSLLEKLNIKYDEKFLFEWIE